jgi:L-alanine-DL-glutamate epimerase-like enolase superfamily enzyme
MDTSACWTAIIQAIRNIGDTGVAMMAASAIDGALWDLKARLLKVPLVSLLGQVRPAVRAYGSGGFTSYTIDQLQEQLGEWASHGFKMVKMKVGRDSKSDLERVKAAREAIGPDVELFVDANGGYNRKQALIMAEAFNQYRVKWFEEPVIHHDLEGLRLLRDRVPAGMDISIGEYGFDLQYFRRCLDAQALDVLQADATRCGITGFLQADVLSLSHFMPLSSHCAPSLHLHPCCAAESIRHLEYFYDHVRIEHLLFEGVIDPVDGMLSPDLTRFGNGLELRRKDTQKYEQNY